MPEIRWPRVADPSLREQILRVVLAVVELGGAVGWPDGLTRGEADAWLDGVLANVAAGEAAFAVAVDDDGVVQGCGRVERQPGAVHRHTAVIRQVMTAPAERGRGYGRLLVEALIGAGRGRGHESLLLSVRGNNHGAQRLYESLGFTEVGVVRNGIAVGHHRFDAVTLQLLLDPAPAGAVVHGRNPEGPGAG